VQRLFSTFPSGWPGAGLLLLRLGLGAALICIGGVAFLTSATDAIATVETFSAIGGGLLLLAGLWTPLAGGLAALAEVGQALSRFDQMRDVVWIHAFLALLSVSVALLGPGAWSIDARLFGRKRFDLDRTRDREL
jgi:putative oxidoreductase